MWQLSVVLTQFSVLCGVDGFHPLRDPGSDTNLEMHVQIYARTAKIRSRELRLHDDPTRRQVSAVHQRKDII